jgi:WD40 repeat protein
MICKFQGHEDEILSLDFNIDGSKLVSGGKDKSIKIWSVLDKNEIGSIEEAHKVKKIILWLKYFIYFFIFKG